MRILLFLLLIIILTSCDEPRKSDIEELNWPKRTVKLDNDLGVLMIRLPEEFDTIFKWLHVSDCRCCEAKKYRLQNSHFPIIKESGFFSNVVADSIYSLTISHSPEKFCNANIDYQKFDISNFFKNQKYGMYLDRRDTTFEINKIEKINGKSIIVLAYKNVNNLRQQTLESWINAKNDLIKLEFNCAASNCDSFIPKMYKALKTVQIKLN